MRNKLRQYLNSYRCSKIFLFFTGRAPSPIKIPNPPAIRYCRYSGVIEFTAKATPNLSSERPQVFPLMDTPAEKLELMSVKAVISFCPLFQLYRQYKPI